MFFANGPEDLPSPTEVLTLSGLDFMKGILEGRFPAPSIARTMDYTLRSVEEGRVVFRGAPTFDVTNPMGTVHGGWYGTLLDSALACAITTRLPKGRVFTTLEYKVNIVRAIPLGMLVDCWAETDHVGRSTGVAHGEIRGVENGKLYATGSTTCATMNAAP
jgi:uncharacterized protein (TIGR00369 family)